MSIFRRDTSAPAASAAAGSLGALGSDPGSSARGRVTHIAPGSRIQGEVNGATEIVIDGEVEGTVKVEAAVTVGAEGVVKGPITARLVKIIGKVSGAVHGTERVEVGASAVLEGDISSPRVVIAEGAFFKGKVEMLSEKPKAGKPQQTAEPKREP